MQLAGIPEGGPGYRALGEGVRAEWEDTVGLRKGRGEGEGGPSVSTLLFAGAAGESWQDHAFRNAFPGSGGQTFSMVNLDGGVLGFFKENKLPPSPPPPWVRKKQSFGMLSSSWLSQCRFHAEVWFAGPFGLVLLGSTAPG